jgi:hypothetical protein
MKFSEIKPASTVYCFQAGRKRDQKESEHRGILHRIFILGVDKKQSKVLASINAAPAHWYDKDTYRNWSAKNPCAQ